MRLGYREFLAFTIAVALVALLPGCAAATPPPSSAAAVCTKMAAPYGSNRASGTASSPFRTVQRLLDALRAGETGCLLAGSYYGDIKFTHGGRSGAPVTLKSAPGRVARIVGRLWIPEGSNYVDVDDLRLDARNDLPSPSVDSADDQFLGDDVTNQHTDICFDLGDGEYGAASKTLIAYDRIHACGSLPPGNHEHGIYVADATNTTIEWNLIYDNADRGIQLYPDAQDTTIDHNVIADNGENFDFSGDEGTASDNADVYDNIIADPASATNIYSWYPLGSPLGTGNVLQDNCVYGGSPAIDTSGGGFTPQDNLIADPEFVNAAAFDYGLRASSQCLPRTGNIEAAVDHYDLAVGGGAR